MAHQDLAAVPNELVQSEYAGNGGKPCALGRKVLVLVQHPTIRGPLPKHTPLLIEGLRETGLTVSTEYWGRRSEAEPAAMRFLRRFGDLLTILRCLKRQDFDALVMKSAHDWPALIRDVPLALLARPHVPSIVVQFHGGWPDRLAAPGFTLFKWISSLLQRFSSGFLLLSSEECRDWERFRPRGRYRCVSNPFDMADTAPAFRAGWKGGSAAPTILFVGRLLREKGVIDLLEAAALMKDSESFGLHIVGSGPLAAEAKSLARELGIEHRVQFRGYLEGEELKNAYREADLFVLPTYWGEGFPTVITEAMSMGLPIVTTRLRGTADHLRSGDNVLFVPPRDPNGLAKAISSVLSSRALRARMYAENLKKVTEFHPRRVARGYAEALADICNWNPMQMPDR